jgi:hypothetical protein
MGIFSVEISVSLPIYIPTYANHISSEEKKHLFSLFILSTTKPAAQNFSAILYIFLLHGTVDPGFFSFLLNVWR